MKIDRLILGNFIPLNKTLPVTTYTTADSAVFLMGPAKFILFELSLTIYFQSDVVYTYGIYL